MIHYHGTPISPRERLFELVGRCFCVSFAEPRDLAVCLEIGSALMLDNGAYTFWKRGEGDVDVDAFATWAAPSLHRRENWLVIPDKIDADEAANDALLAAWERTGLPRQQSAPVWHLHEPIDRLTALGAEYPRVCIGSSGAFSRVDSVPWRERMAEAMDALCGHGPPPCWLHMLRGMKLAGSDWPFASADSVSLAVNHAGNNTRGAPPKSLVRMADEVDGRQCAGSWRPRADRQLSLRQVGER